MTSAELIAKLNADLKNEWKHLRFYLHHASMITGLHAHEYKEFLLEQAASEMRHVQQFSDMILGLGGVPTAESAEFPVFRHAVDILQYAAGMELEVVRNYAERIAEIDSVLNLAPYSDDAVKNVGMPAADKKWLEIFLEEQLKDSREDLDHLRQILAGVVSGA